MHIDLPDYGGSDLQCSPDLRNQQPRTVSWESPVLGESASMYEAEEAVQDILSQVKRLLAEPAHPGSIFYLVSFRISNCSPVRRDFAR